MKRSTSWMLRLVIWGIIFAVFGALLSNEQIRNFAFRYAQAKTTEYSYKLLKVTPQTKYDQRNDDVRLRPDRRFTVALEYIGAITHGTGRHEITPDYRDGQWFIPVSGYRSYYFLPQIPSFSIANDVIREEALNQVLRLNFVAPSPTDSNETNKLTRQLATFSPVKLFDLMIQLDKRWADGIRTKENFILMAKAYVRLAFISLDEIEIADVIQAKAQAFLALAWSISDEAFIVEESMLAYRMGYKTHAWNLARTLPDNHYWRLFIEERNDEFFEVAWAGDAKNIASEELRYLAIRRAAELNKVKLWEAMISKWFADGQLPLSIISTGYYLRNLHYDKAMSSLMPYFVIGDLAQFDNDEGIFDKLMSLSGVIFHVSALQMMAGEVNKQLSGDPNEYIDFFEIKIDSAGDEIDGEFIDANVFESFYRGYFYSSLYKMGIYTIYHYSSVEATNKFLETLGSPNVEMAGEFQRWFAYLSKIYQGKDVMGEMIADIGNLDGVGVPMLLRILKEVTERSEYGSDTVTRAFEKIMPRLDSRLEHRWALANILQNNLHELILGEDIYKSILRDNRHFSPTLEAWLSRYYDDIDNLIDITKRKTVDQGDRAYALDMLRREEGYDEIVTEGYRDILNESPANWYVRRKYIQYLEDSEEYDEALKVAQDWFFHGDMEDESFDYLNAVIAISRINLHLGRQQQGWAAIESTIASYYGNAMRQAITVLIAGGEYEAALMVATKMAERYPNSLKIYLSKVKVYWAAGDYRDAAMILKQWPGKITLSDWRFQVGELFWEMFSDKSIEQIDDAFEALIFNNHSMWGLSEVAAYIAQKDRYDIAFRLHAHINVGGGGAGIEKLIQSYRYLKKWRGQQAAAEWIEKKISMPLRNLSSMISYDEGEYRLLWDLIPNPALGEHPESVWLYRAAAYAEGARIDFAEKEQLTEYYQNADNRFYHLLGKYMLGLVDKTVITQRVVSPQELCESAYFLGLRALIDGQYREAINWFHVSYETGLERNGELRWSYDRMYVWSTHNRSLDVLAQQGKLLRGDFETKPKGVY